MRVHQRVLRSGNLVKWQTLPYVRAKYPDFCTLLEPKRANTLGQMQISDAFGLLWGTKVGKLGPNVQRKPEFDSINSTLRLPALLSAFSHASCPEFWRQPAITVLVVILETSAMFRAHHPQDERTVSEDECYPCWNLRRL